jgi:hypothetical protein
MRDLELSIQDLNDLYESGNIDPAAKTTLHWVVKRLDAMIFSMKKGQV